MKKEQVIQVEETGLVAVDENENEILINQPTFTGDDGSKYVQAMSGEKKIAYSSINQEALSFKEKAIFVNIISGDAELISDHIGETIMLKDIYLEIVDVIDTQTQELKKLPRQVLIDVKGKAFTCSSPVFANKLAQMVNNMGHPFDWEEPVPIKFKQVKSKNDSNKKMLTFDIDFK